MILKQNICNGEVSVTQKCKQINKCERRSQTFYSKKVGPVKKNKKMLKWYFLSNKKGIPI